MERVTDPEQVRAALRRTSLLACAAPATLARLAGVATLRTLVRDDLLLRPDDPPTAMFVAVSGVLGVDAAVGDVGSAPTVVFPGDHVAAIRLVDPAVAAAPVLALRPASVLELPAAAFHNALDRDSAIASALLRAVVRQSRAADDERCDLVVGDLGGRLARYLASELVAPSPVPFVDASLTGSEQRRLAEGAHLALERELLALERDGLIARRGGIEVLDPARLRAR